MKASQVEFIDARQEVGIAVAVQVVVRLDAVRQFVLRQDSNWFDDYCIWFFRKFSLVYLI